MDIEDRIMSDLKRFNKGQLVLLLSESLGEVVELKKHIDNLEAEYSSLEQQIKRQDLRDWMTRKNAHITEQADTNRLLCRSLDEAERRIEELTGISV